MQSHKISYDGFAKKNDHLQYGDYGIQALEGGYVTDKQIERVRSIFTKNEYGVSKVWINIFPSLSMENELSDRQWASVVKEGKVIFEFSGVILDDAKLLNELISQEIDIKCRVISKNMDDENIKRRG